MRLWDGSPIPSRLGQRVLIEFDRFYFVYQQILAVEQERRRLTKVGQGRDAVVARKLLTAMWRWVEQGVPPRGALLKA